MSYEIRAMSLGEVLDVAFRLVRNHFVLLVGIGFVVSLPAQLLETLTNRLAEKPSFAAGAGVAGVVLFFVIVSPIVSAAITHAVGELYLGRQVTLGNAFGTGLRLFWRLLGTALLMTLFVILGLLLLLVPGLYLALAFMLTYQVIVLEGSSGMAALRRSRELTRGNLLRVLAIYVIALVLMSVVGLVVGVVVGQIPVVREIGNSIVQAIMTAFMSAAFVVLYFEIRCRKEAFDLEHLARIVETGGASPTATP